MSTVRELHDQAMILAQDAFIAKERGNSARAAQLASEAVPLELEAAERIPKVPGSEPTRAILYRSAASLAYQANDFSLAKRLTHEGLSGWPPPYVEDELVQLLEQITFADHLRVRDVVLVDAQVQLALVGNIVGSGQIGYKAFLDRIESLVTLLNRTMGRLVGQRYQRGGKAPDRMRPLVPLVSTPRTGSFAVTVELAERSDTTRSYWVTAASVIDEVLSGVDLVQNGDIERLRSRVNDPSYFANFLSLSQQLAPDGEDIKMVGLTSPKREVSFTRQKREVFVPPPPSLATIESESPRTYRGILDLANGRGSGKIGFTSTSGETFDLQIQEGWDDMVRAYFLRQVEVTIYWHDGERTISNIYEIDEDG